MEATVRCGSCANGRAILSRIATANALGPTAPMMIFHPDPHYEDALRANTGGRMLFVQYSGPTTGGKPIYDGRFNMKERKAVNAERLDR